MVWVVMGGSWLGVAGWRRAAGGVIRADGAWVARGGGSGDFGLVILDIGGGVSATADGQAVKAEGGTVAGDDGAANEVVVCVCVDLPAEASDLGREQALGSEADHAWGGVAAEGEEAMEVGVEREDDSVALQGLPEDELVGGPSQAQVADVLGFKAGVVELGDGGAGQSLVEQELHDALRRSMRSSSR